MITLGDLIAPFSGQHNALRGGWSDDQHRLVIEALQRSTGLPFTHADAMMACSLVAEERTTGMSLRYSRSQRNYSYFEAYQADPLMTYRRVVSSADRLIALGLAEGHKGVWGLRKQSILRATPKMMALVGHLVDIPSRRGATLKDEIVLRDRDGKAVGYFDTAEIRLMRQNVKTINAHLSQQTYLVHGTRLYVPPAARIFNQSFRRGGRLYHQGCSYQQMPKQKRTNIQMLVDDVVTPTVERDFESLHMRLTYRRAGKQMPSGDLYEIDGFSRTLTKLATLVCLNAAGTEVGAITSILDKDEDLAQENGLYHLAKWELKAAIEKLIAAIKRKHYRVKEFFGTGVGAELMRTDSDMAIEIMLNMMQQTGRCPLVLHDSFIVPVRDAPLLDDLMGSLLRGNASRHSLDSSAPLPIHLGKQALDQDQRRFAIHHEKTEASSMTRAQGSKTSMHRDRPRPAPLVGATGPPSARVDASRANVDHYQARSRRRHRYLRANGVL